MKIKDKLGNEVECTVDEYKELLATGERVSENEEEEVEVKEECECRSVEMPPDSWTGRVNKAIELLKHHKEPMSANALCDKMGLAKGGVGVKLKKKLKSAAQRGKKVVVIKKGKFVKFGYGTPKKDTNPYKRYLSSRVKELMGTKMKYMVAIKKAQAEWKKKKYGDK